MLSEFCDWVPCRLLQQLVDQLLSSESCGGLVQVTTASSKSGAHLVITFYYCPFCGTRLAGNKEISEWISKRTKRVAH